MDVWLAVEIVEKTNLDLLVGAQPGGEHADLGALDLAGGLQQGWDQNGQMRSCHHSVPNYISMICRKLCLFCISKGSDTETERDGGERVESERE